MTALIIVAAVLLLLFLPLTPRLSVEIKAGQQGQLVAKVRYLFLRFNISPDKLQQRGEKKRAKTEKKAGKQKKTKKSPQESSESEEEKESVRDKLGLLYKLLIGSKKGVRTVRRHLVISRVKLYIAVGGDDAHQIALRYSHICMLVAAAMDVVGLLFVLKKPKVVGIRPNFTSPETRYELAVRIGIRPVFLLSAGLRVLFPLAGILLGGAKLKGAPQKKKAKKQKSRPVAKAG